MKLLEPLRRQRDKLARELHDDTEERIERDAIALLVAGNTGNYALFMDRFCQQIKCEECHQPMPGRREWTSDKHRDLYYLCREIEQLEAQEYRERMQKTEFKDIIP